MHRTNVWFHYWGASVFRQWSSGICEVWWRSKADYIYVRLLFLAFAWHTWPAVKVISRLSIAGDWWWSFARCNAAEHFITLGSGGGSDAVSFLWVWPSSLNLHSCSLCSWIHLSSCKNEEILFYTNWNWSSWIYINLLVNTELVENTFDTKSERSEIYY